jgi:hypothetical protein
MHRTPQDEAEEKEMIDIGFYSLRDPWAVELVESLRTRGTVITYDVQTYSHRLPFNPSATTLTTNNIKLAIRPFISI